MLLIARFNAWISSFVHTIGTDSVNEKSEVPSILAFVGESGRTLAEDEEAEETDLLERVEVDAVSSADGIKGVTVAEAAAFETIYPNTLEVEVAARFFSKSKAYNSLATVEGIESLLVILSSESLHFVVRK